MALSNLKQFVLNYKEVIMFLGGFGVIHYGWYSLQRSSTLNKAISMANDKEKIKEYKRLEKEINWLEQQNKQQKNSPV